MPYLLHKTFQGRVCRVSGALCADGLTVEGAFGSSVALLRQLTAGGFSRVEDASSELRAKFYRTIPQAPSPQRGISTVKQDPQPSTPEYFSALEL